LEPPKQVVTADVGDETANAAELVRLLAARKLARILFAMLRDRRSFDPQLLGTLNEKHLRRRQNSLRKYAASLEF
jgi:hypothetical protein